MRRPRKKWVALLFFPCVFFTCHNAGFTILEECAFEYIVSEGLLVREAKRNDPFDTYLGNYVSVRKVGRDSGRGRVRFARYLPAHPIPRYVRVTRKYAQDIAHCTSHIIHLVQVALVVTFPRKEKDGRESTRGKMGETQFATCESGGSRESIRA